MFKVWLKKNSFHILCVLISVLFICLAIFVFSDAWIRIKESFVDLWSSIKYYIYELLDIDNNVTPSVTEYSSVEWTPFLNLPATWEEFKVRWSLYWQVWATGDNFNAYLGWWSNFLYIFSRVVLLVVIPLVILFFVILRLYLSKHNNNYNVDSKPLTIYKKFVSKVLIPIKEWCCDFANFIRQNKMYFILWCVVIAYMFNFFTICVEFLAFYFYFVFSFDFLGLYKQFVKLFCDLSVVISTLPLIVWIILIYLFICFIRKKIGYKRLNHLERKNCGFINERPICSLVCGTMGKKKTTAITDMVLSQETMLKDKAFEKILELDLKFPNFAWCNFENILKYAMYKHEVFNLATCKMFVKKMCYLFNIGQTSDKQTYKAIKRYLKKEYGYRCKNLIFDYDFEDYGLLYDDKLQVIDIWQVLETYAQLYFVYIIQSSLILSNYSVRTDMLLDDLGNFPLWNTDFFKRDSRLIDSFSRHSHIIDFDALRLGRKIIADNPNKDSFEFGVVNITEVGKERKNQLELRETKKKEDITNQKNDGFTDWLKMIRHSATIDNFPFVKVFTDEQRPESLGADARDLCEIVRIVETSETKLLVPFFSVTNFICSFVVDKFSDFYCQYRYIRSDNTLFLHLFKSLSSGLYSYKKRMFNLFSMCELKCNVEEGTMDGVPKEYTYYLMSKKIYSKRFSTDCFSDYFVQKTLKSDVGLDDLPEYETEKATFDELQKQNSYFINDLLNKQNRSDEDG